jgi:hypothetical protein
MRGFEHEGRQGSEGERDAGDTPATTERKPFFVVAAVSAASGECLGVKVWWGRAELAPMGRIDAWPFALRQQN